MFRFMLGNVHDLVAAEGRLELTALSKGETFSLLDKWSLCLVGRFCVDCLDNYYPQYRYESLVAASDQLVSRISTVYFNAVKDV